MHCSNWLVLCGVNSVQKKRQSKAKQKTIFQKYKTRYIGDEDGVIFRKGPGKK